MFAKQSLVIGIPYKTFPDLVMCLSIAVILPPHFWAHICISDIQNTAGLFFLLLFLWFFWAYSFYGKAKGWWLDEFLVQSPCADLLGSALLVTGEYPVSTGGCHMLFWHDGMWLYDSILAFPKSWGFRYPCLWVVWPALVPKLWYQTPYKL